MRYELFTNANRLRSQLLHLAMRLFLCLLLLTLGGAAFAADFVEQLRSGNRVELERMGERVGATGLAHELISEDRIGTLAALHAATGAEDSWALLGLLAQRAADPDRSIATLAAQVGVEIAHQLDGYTIDLQEIPTQNLLIWHSSWLEVAKHPQRWVDIRVYALEAAERLRSLIAASKQPEVQWDEFLGDSDAEMRAAAIAFAPRGRALEPQALALLRNDASPQVVLTAAQWLCGPLGSRRVLAKGLDASTAARLQALASNTNFDVAARADLANCLVAEASEESRRALAVLLHESTPALRRALLLLIQPPSQAP